MVLCAIVVCCRFAVYMLFVVVCTGLILCVYDCVCGDSFGVFCTVRFANAYECV